MSAFFRSRSHLDNEQADVLWKTAVLANLDYFLLILKFSSKAVDNEINRTHK